jgi:hypothetical protein
VGKVSRTWKERGKEMALFRATGMPTGRYRKLIEDKIANRMREENKNCEGIGYMTRAA